LFRRYGAGYLMRIRFYKDIAATLLICTYYISFLQRFSNYVASNSLLFFLYKDSAAMLLVCPTVLDSASVWLALSRVAAKSL
jgi:hypothetical protein